MNPLNPKKLLLTKWTAVKPVAKQKHFLVSKVIKPDLPNDPVEWVEIDFEKQLLSLKGNEGVGNGVDPNTPGALHNGNNDAPGYFPGNPGAKNKVR